MAAVALYPHSSAPLYQGDSSSSLWQQLHTAIRELHGKAKQNPFLNNLISGHMDCAKAYVVYLCNLYWLHCALESAQKEICMRYRDVDFVMPGLYRSDKLLEDIKLWSFLNPTAPFFADHDPKSEAFLHNVEYFVQPCTVTSVKQLAKLTAEEPLLAVGAMYALYGTIMSGGQLVKKGVKEAFLRRLDYAIETHDDDDDPAEFSHLKKDILTETTSDPKAKERYAERSVSFFELGHEHDMADFKKEWHAALDAVLSRIPAHERPAFIDKTCTVCQASVQVVLDLIDSMLENLRMRAI